LFERYLYQDLEELLVQDASNLGTEIMTTEQEVQKLLNKLDQSSRVVFEALDMVAKDSAVLNNTSKAEDMLNQVQKMMQDKGVVSRMTTSEIKLVENEFRGRIRKNYGINCENTSLDKYEDIIGFPAVERNMSTIKLKVMPLGNSKIVSGSSYRYAAVNDTNKDEEDEEKDEDEDEDYETTQENIGSDLLVDLVSSSASQSSTAPSAPPKKNAFALLLDGSKKQAKEEAKEAALRQQELAQFGSIKKRRKIQRPAFMLVGRVDAVSYQMDMRDDDATRWGPIKVVVEMKSRVRRVASPAPMYEQIQLVSYMVMLDCSCGDLVQAMAVKDQVGNSNSSGSSGSSSCTNGSSSSSSCTSGSSSSSCTSDSSSGGGDGCCRGSGGEADEDKQGAPCVGSESNRSTVNSLSASKVCVSVSSSSFADGIPLHAQVPTGVECTDTVSSATAVAAAAAAAAAAATTGMTTIMDTTTAGSFASSVCTAAVHVHVHATSISVASSCCSSSTFLDSSAVYSGTQTQQQKQQTLTTTTTTTTTTAAEKVEQPSTKWSKPDPNVLYCDEDRTFHISRIYLDGPPYFHRKYWDSVIIPRLHVFSNAVTTMRSDDSMRYTYIMSSYEEKMKILQNLCPYLD
jgi:hypothetical protein